MHVLHFVLVYAADTELVLANEAQSLSRPAARAAQNEAVLPFAAQR
jgi:hypothetical protein